MSPVCGATYAYSYLGMHSTVQSHQETGLLILFNAAISNMVSHPVSRFRLVIYLSPERRKGSFQI